MIPGTQNWTQRHNSLQHSFWIISCFFFISISPWKMNMLHLKITYLKREIIFRPSVVVVPCWLPGEFLVRNNMFILSCCPGLTFLRSLASFLNPQQDTLLKWFMMQILMQGPLMESGLQQVAAANSINNSHHHRNYEGCKEIHQVHIPQQQMQLWRVVPP